MKYEGNLQITSSNIENYKNITEVSGNLSIYSGAKLEANELKSVGGNLYIYSGAKLEANELKSVGGNLSIYSGAKLEANKLKSVGGDLYIDSDAKLEANELKSVGGNLYMNSDVKLEANKLESVGGNLYMNSDAILSFPNNVSIGCLRKICGDFESIKFELIDGIPCAVLSSKKKNGIVTKKCKKPIFNNGGLVGDAFFIASDGKINSHGKTIQEAIEELQFKGMSRDIEKYRGMSLEERKTPKEWALIYRAITGACKLGTDFFMEERKLKKDYSLKEIIKETDGAYGSDKFREIIGFRS